MRDPGPYETERQARAAAHAVIPPEDGWSVLRSPGNLELLHRALTAAGVPMGAYDEKVAAWLAGFEDAACAVIAGWVTRAAARNATGEEPE